MKILGLVGDVRYHSSEVGEFEAFDEDWIRRFRGEAVIRLENAEADLLLNRDWHVRGDNGEADVVEITEYFAIRDPTEGPDPIAERVTSRWRCDEDESLQAKISAKHTPSARLDLRRLCNEVGEEEACRVLGIDGCN